MTASSNLMRGCHPVIAFLLLISGVLAQNPESPSDICIENHLGASAWRPTFIKREKGKSGTFLFADQLELGDNQFSFVNKTAPRNVFIFARRLVLTGKSSFDLVSRSKEDPGGGSLLIVAEVIEIRRGASCTALLRGWNGRNHERFPSNVPPLPPGERWAPKFNGQPGGNGGSFIVACGVLNSEESPPEENRQINLPPEIAFPAPKFSKFDGHVACLLGKGSFKIFNPGGYGGLWFSDPSNTNHIFEPNGSDGETRWCDSIEDAAPFIPDWVIGLQNLVYLENILFRLNDALRREDQAQLVQQLLRYKSMRLPQVPESLTQRWTTVSQAIDKIRREELKPLWSDSVTVRSPAGTRVLTRFVEKGSLENRLAPSEVLVRPRAVGGVRKLGILSRNTQFPERVDLSFDADLTLDPGLAILASTELATSGQNVAGVFANWKLSVPEGSVEGVSKFAVRANTNVLQCTLTLDPTTAALTLWRLNSPMGLAFSLHYECVADTSIQGDLRLALSFCRQTGPDITLVDGFLQSHSNYPATIGYYLAGDQIITLNPEMVIGPSERKPLPLSASVIDSGARLSLPPQAVTFERDPGTLEGFETAEAGPLVESVKVMNTLGFHQERGGALKYAEVYVVMDEDEPITALQSRAGPYRLAPVGAEGAEKIVSLIRQRGGQRRFHVEGTAYYQNGRFTIASSPSESAVITIGEDLLPAP